MEENKIVPKVFISYSWAVADRVRELAERLVANGVDVVIDIWDLKVGHEKYSFMEQAVNDPSISKVLIICDESYMIKANTRKDGVGDETTIISPEIYGKIKQEKFIPVIFEKDLDGKGCVPHFVKSTIYIDLSADNEAYEQGFEKLLRSIYDKPLFVKPAIGRKPDWLDEEIVDVSAIRDIIKQTRGISDASSSKSKYLARKAVSAFVETASLFSIPENKPFNDGLLVMIDQIKLLRDSLLDYFDALLFSAQPFAHIMTELLENLYNSFVNDEDRQGNQYYKGEAYDFFLWELIISITAFCIYHEKFAELHEILAHTYFLSDYKLSNVVPHTFSSFLKYCETIERNCKPLCHEPNLITLQGEMLVLRERKPILTREAIANADLVLYQLYPLIDRTETSIQRWYPRTGIYHRGKQNFWIKLKSKEQCLLIAPLFGVKTIEQLKQEIALSNEKTRGDLQYSHREQYKAIEYSINLGDIGIMQ